MKPGRLRTRAARGVYVLPTLFTVGNLFCGYLSIFKAIHSEFEIGAALIFAAAVLDFLDGRVARLANATSAFGEQYDSLADLVSFGIAPSTLLFFWALSDLGRLGWAVGFLFVVCGSMRLARFNIQTHVVDKRYFVGLPIPAAASVIGSVVLAHPQPLSDPRAATALIATGIVLSYLMISTIRYRSFKDFDWKKRWPVWILLPIALAFALLRLWYAWLLCAGTVAFALSGPTAKVVHFFRAKRRAPAESRPS
jgi:CDP-diacylglycerol---serine O-phosphatidyltransferase